jgi:plasmid maintenance system killer protein
VDVRFRTRKLQRSFERSAEATRAWGPDVGRRHVQRVTALVAADRVADLYQIRAFDLHPLTGERRGQLALRLTGEVRLILTVEGSVR